MRVYIAGPYTLGDREQNVRNMIDAADRLMIAGHCPYVPLLNHYWHVIHQHRESEWLRQDLQWMEGCEAFIRLPGDSVGADIEEMFAQSLKIPRFYFDGGVERFIRWAKGDLRDAQTQTV